MHRMSTEAAIANNSPGLVRRISRAKNKKLSKNHYDLRIENKYGVTVQELDFMILELCKQFKCYWTVVAKELHREHGIRLSNSSIRERYRNYLDPNIKKEWYTPEEEKEVSRLFWIEGKNYTDINNIVGNHGRKGVKQTLEYSARRALRRLVTYLNGGSWQFRVEVPYILRQFCVSAYISQLSAKWSTHKYSYQVFYYFMHHEGKELKEIPYQLARLVYDRLSEMGKTKMKQRQDYYRRVNPQKTFNEQLKSRVNQKREYTKNYHQVHRQSKHRNKPRKLFRKESQGNELDIDVSMLRLNPDESDDLLSLGVLQSRMLEAEDESDSMIILADTSQGGQDECSILNYSELQSI